MGEAKLKELLERLREREDSVRYYINDEPDTIRRVTLEARAETLNDVIEALREVYFE